jgi:hypothetical protein
MKAYVLTAGAIFGLITVAHIWRIAEEPHLAREPWFMLLTILSAALCVGAFVLVLRRSKRS